MPTTSLKRRCISHLSHHVRRPPSERSCGKCNGNGHPTCCFWAEDAEAPAADRGIETGDAVIRREQALEEASLNNPGSCLSSVSCPFFPLPSPIFASSLPNNHQPLFSASVQVHSRATISYSAATNRDLFFSSLPPEAT